MSAATLDDPPPPLEDRGQLIAALRFASVLEHMLACEYLYAGFSVKRSLDDFSEAVRENPVARRRAQAQLDTSFSPRSAINWSTICGEVSIAGERIVADCGLSSSPGFDISGSNSGTSRDAGWSKQCYSMTSLVR